MSQGEKISKLCPVRLRSQDAGRLFDDIGGPVAVQGGGETLLDAGDGPQNNLRKKAGD